MPAHRSALQRLALLALLAGITLWLPAPLRADPTSGSAAAAQVRDPVVAEVLRLLESGLGEPVILRWLAEESRPPGRPTADELVALKQAGASDALITALLDRVAPADAPPESAPKPSAAPARVAVPAPAGAPAPPPDAPPGRASAPAPAAVEPEAEGTVALSLSTLYIHWPEEGEPWDLVVYLDGEPFAPLPAARSARNAERRLVRRDVAPGFHVLRWSQERHGERAGERGLHAARFDPEPLSFTLAAGAHAEITIEFRDPSGLPFATAKGPITVRVAQGGEEIAARLEGGGEAARWPDLCEEIEANLEGGKPSFQERQLLKSCLRWAELWSALPGPVPDRDSARRRLTAP